MSAKSTGKAQDKTDLKRLDAMSEDQIEAAAQSDPESLLLEQCDMATLQVVMPKAKQSISLRVVPDQLLAGGHGVAAAAGLGQLGALVRIQLGDGADLHIRVVLEVKGPAEAADTLAGNAHADQAIGNRLPVRRRRVRFDLFEALDRHPPRGGIALFAAVAHQSPSSVYGVHSPVAVLHTYISILSAPVMLPVSVVGLTGCSQATSSVSMSQITASVYFDRDGKQIS